MREGGREGRGREGGRESVCVREGEEGCVHVYVCVCGSNISGTTLLLFYSSQ